MQSNPSGPSSQQQDYGLYIGPTPVADDPEFEQQLWYYNMDGSPHEFRLGSRWRVMLTVQDDNLTGGDANREAVREARATFYNASNPSDAPIAFALIDFLSTGECRTSDSLLDTLDEDSGGAVDCGEFVQSFFQGSLLSTFRSLGRVTNFYELQFRPSAQLSAEDRIEIATSFMDHLTSKHAVGLHLVALNDDVRGQALLVHALVQRGGFTARERLAYGLSSAKRAYVNFRAVARHA